MSHSMHDTHGDHEHTEQCGHTAVVHEGHIDYLHEGHLHHPHEGHYDEHVIGVNAQNPASCQPMTCSCGGHDASQHEQVPHGDHHDYLYQGRLHHPHGDHCDDHGPIQTR